MIKIKPSNHPYAVCYYCGKYVGIPPPEATENDICTCPPYPTFNVGWTCPKCKAVISPSIMLCPHCTTGYTME